MTTMLEKMARAMHDNACTPYGADKPMPESWGLQGWLYLDMARAALLAIREPDEAMLAPACKTHKPGQPMSEARPEECHMIARRRRTFTAMIDAILAEQSNTQEIV